MKSTLFSLIFIFLVIFPKGGFKIGGVPLTWGYFFIGLASLFTLFQKRLNVTKFRLLSLLSIIPLQIVFLTTLLFRGQEHTGYTLSFFISFFCLPLSFYLLLSDSLDIERLKKHLNVGILFIATYGIFLFFWKLFRGSFIEIPFLTVNFHDMGMLETEKCIDRGSGFKLISTYNNGNLFGICLLMLLPIYHVIQKKFLPHFLVKLSLLLTLSRTVWVGLIFAEILSRLFLQKKRGRLTFYLILFACAIFGIMTYFKFKTTFLLDSSLGGRLDQFEAFNHLYFFGENPFRAISEITYLGMLESFGVLGLLTFLIALISPLFITLLHRRSLLQSPEKKGIFLGLITYLFLSLSDGALLLIPTLAFYWALSSMLFEDKFVDCVPAT